MSSSRNNGVENPAAIASDTLEVIGGEAGNPQVSPLAQVHAILRGRYWLAILLAIIGLGIGAPAGYLLLPPTYKSTAVIQIKPYLQRILYQTDQNTVMPMFDAFLQSQVALIRDQRVIDKAMEDPEWKALRRTSLDQRTKFDASLTTEHPSGSELIFVSFVDRDPEAARKAVDAVTTAYRETFGDDNVQVAMRALDVRQQDLLRQQGEIEEQIKQKAKALGAGGVKQMYETKLQQMMRLDLQLQDAKVAQALGPTTKPSETKEVEPIQIMAMRVPEIGRLFATSHDLERQIAQDRVQLGDKHRTVIDEQSKLDSVNAQMEELVKAYHELSAKSPGQSTFAGEQKSADQLALAATRVQKLFDSAKQEADLWGGQWTDIEQLQGQIEAIKTKLDETTTRKEELTIETGVGGRTTVGPAAKPEGPEKDKHIALAAAGGLGLGGLGVGFVLLLGFLDRRVRHISDVPTNRRMTRILGVLPLLPDKDADPEQAMLAAHSVHQIRMLLQHSHGVGKPVFAITSASPGAGKTSLTLALGLSYAASGARTLIIDCDIVGGGMTAKMKKVTRRRLGHILRRVGLINTQQLIAALKESKQRGELLGQTLVRLGLVTSAAVDHALEVQRDAVVGLREALQGDPANECITSSGSPGLSLMPLGSAQRHHVAQLSYPALRRLIDQVRAWFDVILIDTGPIPGSLEASVAAMAADAVVMTVARGEQRPLVERAMDQIAAAGGTIAGIVMNRAGATDIASSGFSSSTRYLPGGSVALASSARFTIPDHEGLRLGPIGSAVIALGEESPNETAVVAE